MILGMVDEFKAIKLEKSNIKLQVWDTAGQEKYRSMTRKFYQNCDAVILIYDVCNQESYDSIKNWMKDIQDNSNKKVLKVLLGNKIDNTQNRVISKEDGYRLAKSFEVDYYEASVKYDINITEPIMRLFKEIYSNKSNDRIDTFKLGDKVKKRGKCCK